MLKESTGDKSTEEEKKEVTRRMDVREQPEKRSPSGAVTERETQQEGAKERVGLGEGFLKRGTVGGGRLFCWGFWASPALQQRSAQAAQRAKSCVPASVFTLSRSIMLTGGLAVINHLLLPMCTNEKVSAGPRSQ